MLGVSYPSLTRPAFIASRIAVLGLVVSLAACQQKAAEAPEPVRPVKVVTVDASAATREIVFSGSVRARTESQIGFRIPGKIVERRVSVGDTVEAGEILARLDTADLALAVRSAEANLAAARAGQDVAAAALQRNQALFARGFIAQSLLDQQRLQVDQATSALQAATSARDQAVNQAGYSDLKADAAGIVTAIGADVGQVVGAGTPVVTIARNGETEAAIAVPENQIRYFKPGDTLAVRYWADPAIEQNGTVREVSGSADPASRTFAVRVSLPADPRVRLGMSATLALDVAAEGGAIVVPAAALSERNGEPIVWVVDPAAKTVAPRNVRFDAFAPDGVRISSGLSAGDVVVAAGTQFMTPGKQVRIPDYPTASSWTAALAAR